MINNPYEINRKHDSSKNKEKKNRAEKKLGFSFWLLFFSLLLLFLLQTFRHFYLKSKQHLADLRGGGLSTCRQPLRLPAQFDRGAVVEALAGPPQLAVRRS